MTGLTQSMKPMIWIAAIGLIILLVARAAGAGEAGEYVLLRADTLTTQPRELIDPKRTDLETLRPGDTIIFQELAINLLSLNKPELDEAGWASLQLRAGGVSSLVTLEENSNTIFWPGGRDGWQINVYSISGLRETVRLRAQRTVRPLTPQEEPPVPPKIAAQRAARSQAAAAPAPAYSGAREGAWSARRGLNRGEEISAPGLRLRLMRVDGREGRGARRWATFIVNTSTTSREIRLEEFRAAFVEDFQILVESITPRSRPGEGRVVVTINYLPVSSF